MNDVVPAISRANLYGNDEGTAWAADMRLTLQKVMRGLLQTGLTRNLQPLATAHGREGHDRPSTALMMVNSPR